MTRARYVLAIACAATLLPPSDDAAAQGERHGAPASSAAMRRALDASIERVLLSERYLATVIGLTISPSRMTRSDGFVYLSDLAPVMRRFAELGDAASYVALRRFLGDRMVVPEGSAARLAARYREDAAFEPAAPLAYFWTRKALLEGWRSLGDTASAQLLARVNPSTGGVAPGRGEGLALTADCDDALDQLPSERAPARAVLERARTIVGSAAARAERTTRENVEADGETVLLSCLTRLGLAMNDPDATVRHLDPLLDLLAQYQSFSGRPGLGTGADVLITLHRVRLAGPKWALRLEPAGR